MFSLCLPFILIFNCFSTIIFHAQQRCSSTAHPIHGWFFFAYMWKNVKKKNLLNMFSRLLDILTSFLAGDVWVSEFLGLKCGRLLFKWKYLGTSLRLNCLENTSETYSKHQNIGKLIVMIIITSLNIIRWGLLAMLVIIWWYIAYVLSVLLFCVLSLTCGVLYLIVYYIPVSDRNFLFRECMGEGGYWSGAMGWNSQRQICQTDEQ